MAAISLSLVLKEFIGKNKRTTLLQITDEQPVILRRAVTLFPNISLTMMCYIQKVSRSIFRRKINLK